MLELGELVLPQGQGWAALYVFLPPLLPSRKPGMVIQPTCNSWSSLSLGAGLLQLEGLKADLGKNFLKEHPEKEGEEASPDGQPGVSLDGRREASLQGGWSRR